MTNEIKTALAIAAKRDIRLAAYNGEILIGQTKRGTVTLTALDDGFSMAGNDIQNGQLVSWKIEGKRSFIQDALCNLYQVA